MTEALATLFEGKEIRVYQWNGDPWLPVKDLAAAWGIDRNTPYNMIVRNSALFSGMYRDCYVTSPTEAEVCVNEQGLYLMLGRINADRLKNPEAKEAIIRFQRWVPELIQRYRKKEIIQKPEPVQELDEVIAFDLIEARQIAKLTETDPKVMQAAILRKHGYPELADVMAPPIVHGESGWFKPGALAASCGLSTEQFNNWLQNNPKDPERRPFQYKDGNRLWRLTPLGMEHGQEYQYTVEFTGHKETRIKWRESILIASGLKRPIAKGQAALPARAEG